MSVDITSIILSSLSEPASVSVDGLSVSSRSTSDLIALDRYLAAKAAARLPHRGLRFTRLMPPGAVTRCPSPLRSCC